jgi:hypothetical protein
VLRGVLGLEAIMTRPSSSEQPDKRVCHAPGDRCLACPHYYGKADVCKYAPAPGEKYGPCGICGFSDWPKDCPGRNNDDGTTCAYIDQLQEVAAREALSAAYWKDRADAFEALHVAALSATAPLATEHRARGLTPEVVATHYPQTQHQPDECEICDCVFKIAAEALATADKTASGKGQG